MNDKRIKYELFKGQYHDFILASDNYIQRNIQPVIDIDTCSGLTSNTIWSGTTVNETTLEHISLTGLDNFYISDPNVYNDGDIDNTHTVTIPDNYKFTFHRVSGHTQQESSGFTGSTVYTTTNLGDDNCTIDLNGGFYQGFYKLHDYPVKLLPDRMNKGWSVNMIIKYPNEFPSISGKTLNDYYPNNSGFIFYMGARAENKFHNINDTEISGITNNFDISTVQAYYNQFVNTDNQVYYDFFGGLATGNTVNRSHYGFDDKSEFLPHPLYTTGDELLLNGEDYVGYYNIKDGEFFTGRTSGSGSGLTLNNLKVEGSIIDNNLGIRINSEGKIGYRVLRLATYDPCVDAYIESGVTVSNGLAYYVSEKYSNSSIFNDNNSGFINVSIVFEREVELTNDCVKKLTDLRKGKLTIYVNGRPVLIDDNFNEIIPKELDTIKEFQEGVPFNLSWGGGTQGLFESVTYNGIDSADRGLLLEKNFAGTWGGGLNKFEFYIEPLKFVDIRQKFNENKSIYNLKGDFGGRTTNIIKGL